MNFLKRSWTAVIRRKSKNLILLMIIALMSVFLLSSLAILNAVETNILLAREELGNHATLTFDYKNTVDRSLHDSTYIPQETSIMAYRDEALILAEHEHVEDYNFIVNTYGIAHDFSTMGMSQIQVQGQENPNLVVVGVKDSSLLNSLEWDSINLIEGEDVNKPGEVIIEEDVANLNNISVGEDIAIKQLNGNEVKNFTVVGIYKSENQNLINTRDTPLHSPIVDESNRVYVYYEDAINLKPDSMNTSMGSINLPSPGVDRVVYHIDEPENVQAFLDDGNAMDLSWDDVRLDANDRAYNIMIEPLIKANNFVRKLIIGTGIIGAIVLSLILILWSKERNYETGVLLSLGEEKSRVAGQFILEVLIITFVAFILAILLSNIMAQNFADRIMDRQIEMEEGQDTTVREVVNVGLSESARLRRIAGVSGENFEPIDHINVSVSWSDYFKMILISCIIIIFSIGLPILNVMRFNPKTILIKD